MSELERPWRITVAFAGALPLYEAERLERVLAALESSPFAPNRWQKGDGRQKLSYERDAVLALARRWDGRPLSQILYILHRTTTPRYEMYLYLWEEAGLKFEPDPGLSPDLWPELFALGDAWADILQADWGAVHLWYDVRPWEEGADPWKNDLEKECDLLFHNALLAPGDYYHQGPRGLSMRTYIGPNFVDQLGAERIESLPLEVTALDRGGYQVDLGPEPWTMALDDQLGPWRRGMDHLREAGVLATPVIRGGRVVGWDKGPRCEIRRGWEMVLPEFRHNIP